MLSTTNIKQRRIVKRDTLTSKYMEKKEAEKFVIDKDIIPLEIRSKLINIISMKDSKI
jgi:hypothetical protein